MTIRVLVVDDQAMVRAGFAALLDAQPDIEVVGQAVDGHDGVLAARELRALPETDQPEPGPGRREPGRRRCRRSSC